MLHCITTVNHGVLPFKKFSGDEQKYSHRKNCDQILGLGNVDIVIWSVFEVVPGHMGGEPEPFIEKCLHKRIFRIVKKLHSLAGCTDYLLLRRWVTRQDGLIAKPPLRSSIWPSLRDWLIKWAIKPESCVICSFTVAKLVFAYWLLAEKNKPIERPET